MKSFVTSVLAVALLSGMAASLRAQPSRSVASVQANCAELANQAITATNLLSATVVAAASGLPEYCRVLGYIRPAINFELRLPTQTWNHKFLMAGCGGFCGRVLNDAPNFLNALKRGYATVTTDTGHWGSMGLDGRWAYHNPVAKADYGWRGVNETTRVARQLTSVYYKNDIQYAYYDGCSNGGRQGLMQATRYPDDYDGILVGAPAQNVVGLTAFFTSVLKADRGADGEPILDTAKIAVVRRAVAKQCGDATGLIADPSTCRFDPTSLQCKAEDADDCLTPKEIAVVRDWYAPPATTSGKPLLASGVPYGSEPFWAAGPGMPAASALEPLKLASRGLLSFIIMEPEPGETYDPATFDFDTDIAKIERLGRALTPSADLRPFAAGGGKMIMVQGWADQMVPPAATIDYFEQARGMLGEKAPEALRLFMVPGMAHCGNPPGVSVPGFDSSDYDALTALEDWVEKGVAPAHIQAVKHDASGAALFSRPLCPFPSHPRYRGSGDRNDSHNWSCSS